MRRPAPTCLPAAASAAILAFMLAARPTLDRIESAILVLLYLVFVALAISVSF